MKKNSYKKKKRHKCKGGSTAGGGPKLAKRMTEIATQSRDRFSKSKNPHWKE